MLIAREAAQAYRDRQFDEWTWMKRLTREQVERELRRLRVRPQFRTEPWLHQLVCFWIGMCRPEFLWLLDMGLGKTKIFLDLVTQRIREGHVRHALVTVPRRINLESWADDIALHTSLEPRIVRTEDIDEKWEHLRNPGEVTVIDNQSMHWALSMRRGGRGKGARELVPDPDRVAEVRRLYGMFDVDESHKVANVDSLWWRLLRDATADARYRYASTGTLFGKDVEAVWPQFFLVDRGDTFGQNRGLFRKTFFVAKPNPWGRGEKYTFDGRTGRLLTRMLRHRSVEYTKEEVFDLPPKVPVRQHFEMTAEQRGHYMNALQGIVDAGGRREEREGLWVLMRRILSGYMKWRDEHGEHLIRFKENPKLDGLERLVEESGGAKFVVCHDYTETGQMICDRLRERGVGHVWLYGGTKDPAAVRRRFLDDRGAQVMVMNSEAGGTGNDGMQKVARYMVFYETPTPPITRRQTEDRIYRPGQTETAFVYDMVMRRSLDGGILRDLAENLDTYEAVVGGRRKPTKGFFLTDG